MKTLKTLQQAITYFADPDNCQQYMIAVRWPDGQVRCPQCDSDKVTYLAKQRRWKCYSKHPRPQFSVKVGTIFEDSALGLDKWMMAMWLIANCKNGISSCEIARDLGITQKSAWHMLQRIRLAMRVGSFENHRASEATSFERFDKLFRAVVSVPKSAVEKEEAKERLKNRAKRARKNAAKKKA